MQARNKLLNYTVINLGTTKQCLTSEKLDFNIGSISTLFAIIWHMMKSTMKSELGVPFYSI
eukprot:2272127-Ditylum_brightwellii.AAC.1